MRPREVLTKLVEYHRSFEASDDPPRGRRDIYLDLSLSKKGVCRHRAFAFVISALGLRIPARMVTNEAHAWVEVHDGTLWHRIDLGGAAANFETNTSAQDQPLHTPPPDPFAWPPGASAGEESARRNRAPQEATSASCMSAGAGSASAALPPRLAPLAQDPNRPAPAAPSADRDARPPRGSPSGSWTGRSREAGAPPGAHRPRRRLPPHVRLDVAHLLENAEMPSGPSPPTTTAASTGPVVVPSDFHLGATTTSSCHHPRRPAQCGRGRRAEMP